MRNEFLPVPVRGWNSSSALDLMHPQDAVALRNYIPRESHIELRKGYERLNETALSTPVETLATHRDEDGTETLLCAANGNIYSVNTSTGATSSEGSGYTNNRWQTVNFNNYLLFMNGEDAPLQYDGSTLAAFASPVSGTGLTASDIVGGVPFKGRMYYWEASKAKFWYAGVNAYGGTLTAFPLGVVTQQGGYVVECCTWSRDSGEGSDDLFVILMSTGETLVYSGPDGSSFSLIGKFMLGEPLSVRGSTKLASDRIIITRDGITNLSMALQVGRSTDEGNVGSKIVEAVKQATKQWGDNYGWELIYHPTESLLIANIPRQNDGTTGTFDQYVMNTNTGAWTRLTEMNGVTFERHGTDLYMGGYDGHIYKCFTGTSDYGTAILGTVIPAFNALQAPARKKQLTYVILATNYHTHHNIGCAGLADFEQRAFGNASIPTLSQGLQGEWDVSDWDNAYWAESEIDDPNIKTYQIPVQAQGYALSFKMRTLSDIQTPRFYSFKLKYVNMRTI